MELSTLSDLHNLLRVGLRIIRATTQTPTARTAASSATDEEIDASRRLTRFLISSHNDHTPISSLPPELLARIFHFSTLVEPPWSGVQKLGWIGVTHVCQRWRQVALDDSSLWARIVGVSPSAEWISEALVRARDAPLRFDIVDRPSPGVLSKFRPHMSHTRILRLPRLSIHDVRVVREICSLEAPVLEDFELGFLDASPLTFGFDGGMTLFKGHAPKLRRFITSHITIPWSLVPHGQLTQLRITSSWTPNPGILSLYDPNQLFDLLLNSPRLKILYLEFCLPSVLSQVSHGEPIHLPRLSRLSLSGSTSHVTNFLKRLKLPSSATLRLYCISKDPSTYPDHLILPFISAHFHNPAPVEFKSFSVTAHRRNRLISVAASISPTNSAVSNSSVLEDGRNSQPELILSFWRLPWFGHYSQGNILGQLCGMLAISNLKFLSISACDVVQGVNWYELFQHCKKITTIQAKGLGTSGLLGSLSPPKSSNVTSGRNGKNRRHDERDTQAQVTSTVGPCAAPTSPFPKLTSLLLENLDFGEAMPRSKALYDDFACTLRRRKENKTPLKTLCIDRCVISTKQVNSLQRLVWEVRWDGDEGPPYDESWDDDDYSSVSTQSDTQPEHFPGATQAE